MEDLMESQQICKGYDMEHNKFEPIGKIKNEIKLPIFEQIGKVLDIHNNSLRSLVKDVKEVKEDVTEVKEDVTEVKKRLDKISKRMNEIECNQSNMYKQVMNIKSDVERLLNQVYLK